MEREGKLTSKVLLCWYFIRGSEIRINKGSNEP